MDKRITPFLLIGLIVLFVCSSNPAKSQEQYDFEEIRLLPATSVKDQGRTGTCWVFSTLSFMESEILRMGKGAFDLSEMFVVRQAYIDRAESYVRYHGHLNFGPGAQAWDVLNVIRNDGIVSQQAFPGFKINEQLHDHREMDAVLESYINAVTENRSGQLSPVWIQGYEGILDGYLGEYPNQFSYKDKDYSPKEFRDYLGINPDDYIPLTSFSNHKPYTSYIFESPDNWSMEKIYNLPFDKLVGVMKESILNGYTFAWAADVSNIGFNSQKGLAILPKKDWRLMDAEEQANAFVFPVKQKEITPVMRQIAFDNYSTTDDHLMHVVGIAKDQNGNDYFIVKNSHGTNNPYGGYLYVSEAYVQLWTTSLLLNKDALNKEIKEKLSL